jgi:tricarballylate dehydrogenase
MTDGQTRIVIVGAGVAGLSAALAASEAGASVVVIERAPVSERGGNTRFSGGQMTAVGQGGRDGTGSGRRVSREKYLADINQVTQGRTDKALAERFIDGSEETRAWLFRHLVDSGFQTWSRGAELSDGLFGAVERRGIEVLYETRAVGLIERDGRTVGVRVVRDRESHELEGNAVILAAGGFEANPEWRARYLGPGWDLVKVRGSRFNTGDGLKMALDAGAMPYGNWSGCHAVNWDLNAPEQNELEYSMLWTRSSFNHGIIVNQRGERFLDEGEDVSVLIYAKLGQIILAQPGRMAWQVFDAKASSLLSANYRDERSTRATADTLEGLAKQMPGINQGRFIATVAEYNRAVRTDVPFDAATKDGRGTSGLTVNKSNWAQTLDTPPYEAYGVVPGITFTFGGIRIDLDGRVLDVDGYVIPGLFAAGEMVGGLFYFNYPGGSGLTSAAVFGRIAGETAARESQAA